MKWGERLTIHNATKEQLKFIVRERESMIQDLTKQLNEKQKALEDAIKMLKDLGWSLKQEFLLIIGGKIMDELRTTPHDFIWRVKNPQDYWADTLKEVKYDVYLNGKRRGGFIGVNRTFDDDTYYVNYYDENNNIAYCTAYTDTEIILKRVNGKE